MQPAELFASPNTEISFDRPDFYGTHTVTIRTAYLHHYVLCYLHSSPEVFRDVNLDPFEVQEARWRPADKESVQELFVYEVRENVSSMNSRFVYFVLRLQPNGLYSCVAVSKPSPGRADLDWLNNVANWFAWNL